MTLVVHDAYKLGGRVVDGSPYFQADITMITMSTGSILLLVVLLYHDDILKWKHFPRYWPFVWGIHQTPVNSLRKGQCREALMFPLICAWINSWINSRKDGDLGRFRAHYDVTVMILTKWTTSPKLIHYHRGNHNIFQHQLRNPHGYGITNC